MSVVLIVEDDVDLLEVLAEGLREEGWTVLSAASETAALELARAHEIDVVLCDVLLPGVGGPALGKNLRPGSSTATVPIVFMTGLPRLVRDLLDSTVLLKPFELADLAAALDAALSHRRGGPRPVAASTAEASAALRS